MGLLEKVQQKKQELDLENSSIDLASDNAAAQTSGLLEKARQRRNELKGVKPTSKEKNIQKQTVETYKGVKKKGAEGKEVIEERGSFGWKGLASRRIVFDNGINEYLYEVSEPILNEGEAGIKNELTRLFKMLADQNVADMDEKEKKKYLEDTLEQIIIDNDIKFIPKEKNEEKESGKFHLNLKKIKKPKKDKSKSEHGFKKRELTKKEKETKDKIFYHLFREFLGYGKIDIVMKDDGIEDISCDGHHVPVFLYHKKHDEITTNIQFENAEELNSFVVRLSQICGKQISIFSPIVDGKLPDGSRLQTTLGKTVTQGATFTIRKFKENPLTPIDLVNFKSFSLDMAAYFWTAIENGASILFCGGTASGKTTALNALSLFIPAKHKIVTIEDTRELNLPHKNWIAGTTRKGFSAADNKTGKDIDMFDLIRAALRQRPKVVMVGEVRGKEAYSLFQAMATGHTAYATIHASTIHTLIQRLENPPIELPRALLTSLDLIVFQNAINIGGKAARRMTSITEVIKLDPDTNQLIFMEPFKWVSKTDDRFENSGVSKILNNIRMQNNWSEEQLEQELENRKLIISWMIKSDIRDYRDVGRVVADYRKFPKELLEKARGELKK